MSKRKQVIIKSKYLKLDIQTFADGEISYKVSIDGKEAEKSIGNLSKKAEGLSKKFTSAGKTLSIGLTAPLTAFGAYSVKTATDFDRASNQMKASLGATSSDLKDYETIMKNIYSANYGESFEDVANSIATVSKNLVELDNASLQNITESALTLRDVFGIEVDESVRSVNALMNNFGITADEAMNLLTQGLNSNLNFSDEFIDNINEYSVQFGKLGLTAEDMFDIFQSGADAGAWNLDKIGDAVKDFSIRAIDGSQTTADGFKALGMDADVMAQKFASGGDTARNAFYEVIQALGEMDDPVAQSIAGVNLFGTMWEDLGPQVVTQLGSVKGMYDQTVDSMETMKNVKYDDLGSMLEGLKRSISGVALEIGNSLMPTIQTIIGKISGLVNWFSNLSENGKKVVLTIAGIAMAIGPVITAIGILIETGKKIKTIVTLIKSWNVVTKAMSVAQAALNLVMNANPIGIIITAITAIIAGLVLLYNKCEWFRNAINTVFEFVIGVVQKVIDFFKNNWQTILLFILNPFAGVFKLLYDKFEGFRNFVNGIVEAIKNFFVGLFNKIVEIVKVPIEFIKNAFLLIVAVVATVAETIYNVVSSIVQKILLIVSTIANWIYTNVLQPVFNFFSSVFQAISNVVSNFVNRVISIFSTIGNWIYTNVLQPIFNFFSSIFNSIWNVVSAVIEKVKNGFSAAANFVKNAFDNVKNFITNIFSTVANIIKAPINGIITLINKALKGLNKIKVPDWVPGIGGKGINFPMIPKLSVGTNYVAGDGLAYLHKGEAVVPKKYNPAIGGNFNQSYNYSNDNSETNALLFDLNKGVNALLEKDTNLYVNGKQFAQATFKDFKNEGQRLGASSTVNVR